MCWFYSKQEIFFEVSKMLKGWESISCQNWLGYRMESKRYGNVCINDPLRGVRQALQGDLRGISGFATSSQICFCVLMPTTRLPTEGDLASHFGQSHHHSSYQQEQCGSCLRVLGGLQEFVCCPFSPLDLHISLPPLTCFNGH